MPASVLRRQDGPGCSSNAGARFGVPLITISRSVATSHATFFVDEAGVFISCPGSFVGDFCDRRALRLDLCAHILEGNALGLHHLVMLVLQVLEFLAGRRMPLLESLLIGSCVCNLSRDGFVAPPPFSQLVQGFIRLVPASGIGLPSLSTTNTIVVVWGLGGGTDG